MSELSNKRIGNPTSSDIVSLTSKSTAKGTVGAPFFTYIEECRAERFFKQRIESEVEVFTLQWGKLAENIAHRKLPTDYQFQSDNTLQHPKIIGWCGTPDGFKYAMKLKKLVKEVVTDIKCPTTKKSFFNMISGLYTFDGVNAVKLPVDKVDMNKVLILIRKKHKDGEKFYWQIVSNACISGVEKGELIVFMPYQDEIEEVKEFHAKMPIPYSTVWNKKDEELPFILRESGVEDLNIISFTIPADDKKFLEMRVSMAVELIALDQKNYEELIEKGLKAETEIIKFIEEKGGGKITYIERK